MWRSKRFLRHNKNKKSFKSIIYDLIIKIRVFIGRISIKNRRYFQLAYRFLASNKIQGNYCEFGVYTGKQFVECYNTFKNSDICKNFYAFDSFQGLPELSKIDEHYKQFSSGALSASKNEFIENLKKHKINLSKIRINEGWFEDSLTDDLKSKIKDNGGINLALIDADLYVSTVPVLNFITDLLVDGGIIIFDDWFLFKGNPDLGVQKAFYEWEKVVPFKLSVFGPISDSFQRAFIVHLPIK